MSFDRKAYDKERYHRLKDEGICVNCHKERAVEGKCYCEKCSEDLAVMRQIKREQKRQYDAMRYEMTKQKRLYERRKAEGVCVRCGMRDAIAGQVLCPACKLRQEQIKRKSNQTRYSKLKAAGICTQCGKEPARPGFSKCEKCAAKSALMNRQKRRAEKWDYRVGPRTMLGDEYTPEELAEIFDPKYTTVELTNRFGVIYDQIVWIRRHKDDDLTGLRKKMPRPNAFDGWMPLAKPEGDISHMCGYCEHFTDWKYVPKYGIYGTCEGDGKLRHRCDSCTRAGEYESRGYKCIALDRKTDTIKETGLNW